MQKLQPVRGTKDLLPKDYLAHQHIITKAYEVAQRYGFLPFATPIFEFTNVFKRSLGDYSDVVTKEMYNFIDKGGEDITLRPEFTAAIVRAVISEGLTHQLPLKFFSHGPLFRYERPQRGRLRQFHQINIECLGSASPYCDVEIIALADNILRQLGIRSKSTLELNSLGDKESRAAYHSSLVDYLNDFRADLSEDSKIRLDKNPLRILDSKDQNDQKIVQGAPNISEFFNLESQEFFARLQEGLDSLNIEYKRNPRLVRGLDYYSHTAFEFTTTELGAQATILGGGRYDGLCKLMGGGDIPAVGFAGGIERIAELVAFEPVLTRAVAIIAIDVKYQTNALQIGSKLRDASIATEIFFDGNVGKKMKLANKNNCRYVIYLGEDEIAQNKLKLRNLDSGDENLLDIDQLINFIKNDKIS
jgi:histidyl-tRNA synthetase